MLASAAAWICRTLLLCFALIALLSFTSSSPLPLRHSHSRPLSPHALAPPDIAAAIACDVVVYSATPAGIATAVSAARFNSSLAICLVEAADFIGGMSAAGGIGLRDLGVEDTIDHSLAEEYTRLNAAHYNVSYRVYQPDMDVSLLSFQHMLAGEKSIRLFTHSPLLENSTAVLKDKGRISAINTAHGQFTGGVFIDASYEGDLLVRAGVSHAYGRESRQQYGEADAGVRPYTTFSNFLPDFPCNASYSPSNHSLLPFISPAHLPPPGSADHRVMAYSYRLCITPTKAKQVPFFRPAEYDESRFELLQRYVDSLLASGRYKQGVSLEMLTAVLAYRNYPPADKFDLCDSTDSAFTSDAPDLNLGYIHGSYAQRRAIEAQHRSYVLGLLYYLSTSPRVPAHTRNSTLRYGLCSDQWHAHEHVPPLMYIREAVRLVNDQPLTQNSMLTGVCRADSVALGSWGYDIHSVSRTARLLNGTLVADVEGQLVAAVGGSASTGVYEIPYSVMLPRTSEALNLLVPVNVACTHVTFSSLRVEPHWLQLGEAAGIAAALSVSLGQPVAAVNVTRVQGVLAGRGVRVHYRTSTCPHQQQPLSERL